MSPSGLLTGKRFEAVRIPTGTRLHPWNEPVGTVPVLEHTLADAQNDAVERAGGVLVETPTGERPSVWFTDRQWFTAEALRLLLNRSPGRMKVTDEAFWATTHAQQAVPAAGVMELAWSNKAVVPSLAALDGLSHTPVDLGLEDHGTHPRHPRLDHAHRPLRVGAASVHLVQHWSHLVRVNVLAIQAEAFAARDRFERAPVWQKVLQAAKTIWMAGGTSKHRIAATLVTQGPDCEIHPSAVVEASRIGARVRIGPHAVVRGSVLQDDVDIAAHATVVSTVMGARARLGPYGHLRYSTLFPGARISAGPGFQLCAFGRDCFLAWGVAALDLSFGRTIKTEVAPGERVDTGHHFLGCAVGHRAVVGQGVRLAPGAVVPCEATLVAPKDGLYTTWGTVPPSNEPVTPKAHGVERVSRSADPSSSGLHGLGGRGQDALLGDDPGNEAGGRDVEGEISGRR